MSFSSTATENSAVIFLNLAVFGSLQWTVCLHYRTSTTSRRSLIRDLLVKPIQKKKKKRKEKRKKKSRIIEEKLSSFSFDCHKNSTDFLFYISKYETFSVFLDEGAIVREDVLSCSSSSSKDGVRIITIIIKKRRRRRGGGVFSSFFVVLFYHCTALV